MTTKGINALKGWSIGIGTAVTIGAVGLLSSSKNGEARLNDDIQNLHISYTVEGDTMTYITPGLYDASILTDIPQDSIIISIKENKKIEGYEFDIAK